ncbi:hypothetical protein B0H13DRAFT_2371476 [Mycena leptocephala]|nr:hypothetical protein B0H13DRAFT_2371476 [Mycena leptocephala]
MAHTHTKKNSLPPPARLLGNELGKHPAQLPPQLLAPQKITGPRMLLVSWNADGADPLQIFLPRPKDGWIRLSDHRNALETIHLHPKMQLNRYLRKSRAKHAQWSSFGWGTVINVGAKETLLDAHIATYFDAFDQLVGSPANWKATTANTIVNSPLFKGHLASEEEDPVHGGTPEKWLACEGQIQECGTAVKKAMANGAPVPRASNATAGPSTATAPAASSGKSFFQRPTLTAKRLFEIEKKLTIMIAAAAAAKEKGAQRVIECYQPCKKKIWDALTDEEREDYVVRAETLQHDIGINQQSFMDFIWFDMDSFVKSGLFGPITLTLLYGGRTPKCQLFSGYSSAHSDANAKFFDESMPDWEPAVMGPFRKYLESVFPPPRLAAVVEHEIPLDGDGTPLFPELDLDATPATVVASILREFVQRLWAHFRPAEPFSWNGAALHYDKTRFTLPMDMESVATVKGAAALLWAEYFIGLETRFVFITEAQGQTVGMKEQEQEEEKAKKKGKAKGKGKKKANGKGKKKDDLGMEDTSLNEDEVVMDLEVGIGPVVNEDELNTALGADVPLNNHNLGAGNGAETSHSITTGGTGSWRPKARAPAKAAKDGQDAEERPSKKARAEVDPIVAEGRPRRTPKAACRIPVTVAPKNKVVAPEKKRLRKDVLWRQEGLRYVVIRHCPALADSWLAPLVAVLCVYAVDLWLPASTASGPEPQRAQIDVLQQDSADNMVHDRWDTKITPRIRPLTPVEDTTRQPWPPPPAHAHKESMTVKSGRRFHGLPSAGSPPTVRMGTIEASHRGSHRARVPDVLDWDVNVGEAVILALRERKGSDGIAHRTRRPPAKTTSDGRIAGMVVTTRSHALAALNSLRRHSLASMYAVAVRSPRRLRLTPPDADYRPTRRNSTPSSQAAAPPLQARRSWETLCYNTNPAADIRNYEAGKLTAAALVAKLEFKLGHTKSLARRRREYRKCDKTQIQTHLWLWSYDVPHRYLAERMIHLRLFGRDAQTLVHPCLGCGVQHREFFCLASVRGLAGLHRIVREVLGLLGQKAVKRTLLKPPPELEDIWDLLLYG